MIRLLVLFIFLFACPAWGQNIHVLVNIWDGTEKTVLENLYADGELPSLSSVGPLYNLTCNEDCFDGICMKTVTKPQHATMLTGCLADVHGVFGNGVKKTQLIPDGITVYELIEASNPGYKTAHISGKKMNFGKPTFGNIIEDVDFFWAEDVSPTVSANKAIYLIERWKDKNFFIVCHFRNPDYVGHIYGVYGNRYRRSIKTNDGQLERLIEALEVNGEDAKTIVYVLSDHGFGCPTRLRHVCSPNTFIVSNDPNLTGDISMKDVAGLLLYNFGLLPVCQSFTDVPH
jgi:hypothetical protein